MIQSECNHWQILDLTVVTGAGREQVQSLLLNCALATRLLNYYELNTTSIDQEGKANFRRLGCKISFSCGESKTASHRLDQALESHGSVSMEAGK